GSADLLLPALPKHQVKLFGRGHKDAELGIVLSIFEYAGLNSVNFHRRADAFNDQIEGPKVAPQLAGDLVDERAARRQIRDPAFSIFKLVERLKHPELGD